MTPCVTVEPSLCLWAKWDYQFLPVLPAVLPQQGTSRGAPVRGELELVVLVAKFVGGAGGPKGQGDPKRFPE